jgi:hypothetical protein
MLKAKIEMQKAECKLQIQLAEFSGSSRYQAGAW